MLCNCVVFDVSFHLFIRVRLSFIYFVTFVFLCEEMEFLQVSVFIVIIRSCLMSIAPGKLNDLAYRCLVLVARVALLQNCNPNRIVPLKLRKLNETACMVGWGSQSTRHTVNSSHRFFCDELTVSFSGSCDELTVLF